MNLIEQWQQKKDYPQGVELVALYAPGHPLLPMLRSGETGINRIYLSGIVPELKAGPSRVTTPSGNTTAGSQPPEATYLYRRQRELLKGRAITRNQYHEYFLRSDVPAVQARRRINRQLIDIRIELHDISRQIEYFEKTGKLITVPEVSEVVSPIAQAGHKSLLNARSNVSRWKRKLEKLYNEKAPKAAIEKAELKLKKYQTERDLLHSKLTNPLTQN